MSANKKKHIKTINNLLFHASFCSFPASQAWVHSSRFLRFGLLSSWQNDVMRCDDAMVGQDARGAWWKAWKNIASCEVLCTKECEKAF